MTDQPDLAPADGDTPGPFATPAQDADVRALLGTLRAADVPMPDDVVRRINAAVVAERVASTLPDSPASLVDAADASTSGHGTVTVLPSAEARRGRSHAGLTTLLAVAAAVVVVAGVGAMIRSNGGLTAGTSSSAGAASSAPEDASAGGSNGSVVKATGLEYSAGTLQSQVASLVRGGSPTVDAATGQTATPAVGVPSPQGTRSAQTQAYSLADRDVLAACVAALTGAAAVTPVVVDQGSYGGKPAEVLVLPTAGDPASLDVWVVAPGCGTGPEPTVLEFQRIARP